MGTANKQIATHSNVVNKRINPGYSASYSTTATKCVTKDRVTKVEFLEAKDRTRTTNPYYDTPSNFGSGTRNNMTIINAGYTTNQPISSSNIYNTTASYQYASLAYCMIRPTTSISAYSSVTVTLTGAWPSSSAEDPAYYSMFYKQLTGISTGLIKLEYTISMEGICGSSPTTESSSGSPAPAGVSNATITVGAIVTDSNGQIIGQRTPQSMTGNLVTDSITFTANTSTINVYILIQQLSFTFTAGLTATYAGFKLQATSNVISYESQYDQTYKCVQYQDINHPTGKTFTMYYGIWNNKSSNAKLDNVHVEIKKSTDSTWTTIGTTNLGTIDTSQTGTITCTLPTTFDPTVAYDLRVVCGATTYNQDWYYRWGSQSSLTNSGYSWTSYGKVKTGACPNANGLNTHSAYSTLRNYNWTTTTLARGRSTGQAALFCIE